MIIAIHFLIWLNFAILLLMNISNHCLTTVAAQYEDYIALQGLVIDNPETTALYMQLALNLTNQTTTVDENETALSRLQFIGVIAGAVVASILGCGVALLLCCCCCCRKNGKMYV